MSARPLASIKAGQTQPLSVLVNPGVTKTEGKDIVQGFPLKIQDRQLVSFRIIYPQDVPLPPHTFSVPPSRLHTGLYYCGGRQKLIIKSPQPLVAQTK